MQQEIQAVFNEEFVPTASQSPIGTVGVIDGSGFVKHGTESVRRAAAMVRTTSARRRTARWACFSSA